MTRDERLAAAALAEAGLDVLVMGGHAVRFYGLRRDTDDHDFYTGAASTAAVREAVARTPLLRDAVEGPSWRPDDFTRFQIGTLPDGKPGWADFWVRSPLLDPYPALAARQFTGEYGGRPVRFVSLPDLIRSKETERDKDWTDIDVLEEMLDAQNIARVDHGADPRVVLVDLRSRRGFASGRHRGLFDVATSVGSAARSATYPATLAYLLPRVPAAADAVPSRMAIDPASLPGLCKAEFGSPKHLALVESVRRAYQRHAVRRDQEDKQSRLSAHRPPP